MPGLFIVLDGSVNAISENGSIKLNTFGPGAIFGEMSLVENTNASASIVVNVNQTKLLLCDKSTVEDIIANDVAFATEFHKGIATLLSQKVRQMNVQVEHETQLTNELYSKYHLAEKLEATQHTMKVTNEALIGKIVAPTKTSRSLIDELSGDQLAKANEINDQIQDILVIAQNFDISSQQIHQLAQYIVKIVIHDGSPDVRGDAEIFDKGHSIPTAKAKHEIMFF